MAYRPYPHCGDACRPIAPRMIKIYVIKYTDNRQADKLSLLMTRTSSS